MLGAMWRTSIGSLLFLLACGGGNPGSNGAVLGNPDPTHAAPTDGDIDGDGVSNDMDNCPSLANHDQRHACDYPYPPPAPSTDTSPAAVAHDAVARLNFARALVGLAPVSEDMQYSQGCATHLAYLRQLSHTIGQPQLTQTEDMSRGGTQAGNDAGVGSVLRFGAADIDTAVDGWMSSLYQRIALLHPGLHSIGVAFLRDDVQPAWSWACIQYKPGTMAGAVAPHPILWPPPDSQFTDAFLGAAQVPCPTSDDPLAPGMCMSGAGVASVGLYGMGALSMAEGSIHRLIPVEQVQIAHIWYDGGPSASERMGYVTGSVGVVPAMGSMYQHSTYEARVDATVGGTPQTFRWRFSVNGTIDDTVSCDLFGPQNSFDTAIAVTAAQITGRICAGKADYYHYRDPGTYNVTLTYDPTRGDLDLIAYDDSQNQVNEVSGGMSPATLTGLTGGYIEVVGANGSIGPYALDRKSVV